MPPDSTLRRIVPGRSSRRPRRDAHFAPQLQPLQAAREPAHQRLDVVRSLAVVEIAEVGLSPATRRGSRRASRVPASSPSTGASPHARRSACRPPRRALPVSGWRSAMRPPPRFSNVLRRFGGRKYASNSASKRRHSSPRPHSSACRLQRRTSRSKRPTRSAVSSTVNASLPPTPYPFARRKPVNPVRRVRSAIAGSAPTAVRSACGRDPGDDFARESGAVLAGLDERRQRFDDALRSVGVEARDAESQQRRGPVERLGDARLLRRDRAGAPPARTGRAGAKARRPPAASSPR